MLEGRLYGGGGGHLSWMISGGRDMVESLSIRAEGSAMRAYHFVSRDYGLDDLRRQRLKIATINDLNDPFELLAVSLPSQPMRRAYEQHKEALASWIGMLCFSRTWKNPVQWSHDADRHRGLCLGFDIPDALIQPVSYRPRRVESDIGLLADGGPVAEAHLQEMLSTKYSHWRYEQEVRVFGRLEERDEQTGLYFAPFSDDHLALREIIVGHCCDLTHREVVDTFRGPSPIVSVSKARLAFRSFKVVRQRDVRLWPETPRRS
jgi:hypothetical protein